LVIDIAIAVLLILALVLGYQRGVIQPLLAEIFFFGTLLVIFRFHDTYTNEMEKIAHLNAVFSVAVAIVAAVILGAVGGAIGGAFHRMDAIRGIDGLLGVFVHVIVTLVLIYLAISALVVLDKAFVPTLNRASVTLDQVNQLENQILSNPITAAMVSKDDLNSLKASAAKTNAAHLDAIGGIHALEQLYSFIGPQLHSSRAVPIILSIGDKLPVIGHIGPGDLKPLPTPPACPTPSPSPSPTKSPAKSSPSPKVTPTVNPCASPSPSK
jgi:uncharacterized membrane protein required for colicin V production